MRKSWKALSSLITIQHPSWKTHDPRWSRIEIRCHISKGNALLCAQRRMQKKDRSTVRHIVGSIQWRRNLLNRSRRDNDDSTIQENPLPSLFSFLSKNIEMSRVEFWLSMIQKSSKRCLLYVRFSVEFSLWISFFFFYFSCHQEFPVGQKWKMKLRCPSIYSTILFVFRQTPSLLDLRFSVNWNSTACRDRSFQMGIETLDMIITDYNREM